MATKRKGERKDILKHMLLLATMTLINLSYLEARELKKVELGPETQRTFLVRTNSPLTLYQTRKK